MGSQPAVEGSSGAGNAEGFNEDAVPFIYRHVRLSGNQQKAIAIYLRVSGARGSPHALQLVPGSAPAPRIEQQLSD